MLLLAFDTATPAVTVALHDGADALACEAAPTPRRHGEMLASMIGRVLAAGGAARTDLTAIAVGTGPGPYTGLRAGLVTARVLGSALRIPVLGVCTLDVMARQAVPAAAGREFIVAADARRKEVYWARYAPTGQRLTDPAVSLPAEVAAAWPGVADGTAARSGANGGPATARCPVAGQGPELYADLGACPIPPRYPDAAALAAIAAEHYQQDPAASLRLEPPEPLYLRRPDARVPGQPKRVLPC